MAFKTYGEKSNSGSNVDFDKLNKYVVETAGLQQEETIVGYLVGIVDLGLQELPPAKVALKKDEDEDELHALYPDMWFETIKDEKGSNVRAKCWNRKPQQAVACVIDFPDILVDKAQFFGKESEPLPLRMYLGGQFFMQSIRKQVVGSLTTLGETNKDFKEWSFAKNHLFYKMAVDSGVITPEQPFKPERIDELLGKPFQFKTRIWFKDDKWYTEKCVYQGKLARGQSAPELTTEPFLIQFDGGEEQEPFIKDLRQHVVNTMKLARNYEDSNVHEQVSRIRNDNEVLYTPKDDESSDINYDENDLPDNEDEVVEEKKVTKLKEETKPTTKPKSKVKKSVDPVDEDFDDDIPF